MERKSITEEEFLRRMRGSIGMIALDEDCVCLDDELWDCFGILVTVDGETFEITSERTGEDDFDFGYARIEDADERLWPLRIVSTKDEPISFSGIMREDEFPTLMFKLGTRPLLITASKELTVGISHYDENGDWLDFDECGLLNDRLR